MTDPSSFQDDSRAPYRSAESYISGEIDREELIDRLTSWRYEPGEVRTAGLHDELLNFVAGSFDEVLAAFIDGLLDGELYSIALGALKEQHSTDPTPEKRS